MIVSESRPEPVLTQLAQREEQQRDELQRDELQRDELRQDELQQYELQAKVKGNDGTLTEGRFSSPDLK